MTAYPQVAAVNIRDAVSRELMEISVVPGREKQWIAAVEEFEQVGASWAKDLLSAAKTVNGSAVEGVTAQAVVKLTNPAQIEAFVVELAKRQSELPGQLLMRLQSIGAGKAVSNAKELGSTQNAWISSLNAHFPKQGGQSPTLTEGPIALE